MFSYFVLSLVGGASAFSFRATKKTTLTAPVAAAAYSDHECLGSGQYEGPHFEDADTDKSGKVSEKEFVSYAKRMGKTEEDAKTMIGQADSNGDQSLTVKEFVALLGGGGPPRIHARANRTCRFQNVCYNLTSDTGTLLYFWNGRLDVPTKLDLRPNSIPANGPVYMKLQLVPGTMPPQVTYFRNPVVALFQPIGSENFGHELADDMYGVYVMLKVFRIADPFSAQVLTLDSCDKFSNDLMDRSVCKKMIPKMYPALSRHSVLQLRTSDLLLANPGSNGANGAASQAPRNKSSLMCFHTLLASPGMNSFRVWGAGSTVPHFYWGFRSQLVRRMLGSSCADEACGSSIPVPKRILILEKSTKNRAKMKSTTGDGIENVDAVREHLRAHFPNYKVESVDPASLSFKDQISMLTQTAFLFAHGGGGGFGAFFLPRKATLAVAPAWSSETEIAWMHTLWFKICKLPSKVVSLELAVKIVNGKQPGCLKPLELR